MTEQRTVRVLSLGAGVQSTVLYLLACDGDLLIDAAVFADTGDEPSFVYQHLDWLIGLGGPTIHRAGLGVRLGDQIMDGLNGTGQRFVSIPAFTRGANGNGIQRRQCTREFKLRVIEQAIRREVLGLSKGRPVPNNVRIVQVIGFSADEGGRAERNRKQPRARNWSVEFPLIERGLSRRDCESILDKRVPHKVGRSACVFCPYRGTQEWVELRQRDPQGWNRAVEVDAALRDKASVCTRGMVDAMYVHKSLKPLPEAPTTEAETLPLFHQECIGGCGL